MYVLPQLTNSLKSQNEELVDIKEGINGVNASFAKWFKTQDRQRLDDLEKERDAKAEKAQQKSQARTVSAGVQANSRGSMFSGMGNRFTGLAGGLGLGGMMGALGGTMGKLGIFGAGQLLAGTIGQGVFDKTGNAELAAAAENMTRFAAIGSLFGKKFALLGGVAGAFATPENIQAFKDIGESLGERKDQVVEALKNLGIALPSLDQVFSTISDTSNSILKGINSIISGDVDEMKENSSGIAAATGIGIGAVGSRIGINAMNNTNTTTSNLSRSERRVLNNRTASRLSSRQLSKLAKSGITFANGAMLKNGLAMSADNMDDALRSVGAPTSGQQGRLAKALSRYKNFAKAMKIPILGSLIAAGGLGLVLANDEISEEEKKKQIAGILGSVGGGFLGTALGSLLGTAIAPGIGTGVLGLLGGVLGAFSGDYLAQNLAEYLMGETSDIEKLAKDIQSASGSTGISIREKRRTQGRGIGASPTPIPATQGAQIADGTTATRELDLMGSNGGSSFAVNAPTSNVDNSTSLISHGLGTSDNQDTLMEPRYG